MMVFSGVLIGQIRKGHVLIEAIIFFFSISSFLDLAVPDLCLIDA